MITVSDAYKAEMKKTIRDYCEYVIRWYMCNADLQMANYQVGTNMHNLSDNTFIPKVNLCQ